MKVSGFTAISRVLGFVRDIFIARYLGSGLLGDAFFSAFRFPNLFRRIFGEGAFNAAFVPMFGRRLEKEGEKYAMGFASNAFSTLCLFLVIATIIAIPCMHWIMGLVVYGFKAKVELPLPASSGEQLVESVSVELSGQKAFYLSVESADAKSAEFTLENLRFVKEEPTLLSRFYGKGGRGDEVSLVQVGDDYTEQSLAKLMRANSDEKVKPAREGIDLVDTSWSMTQSGQACIRLPDGHDYGWFEGDLVRSNEVVGTTASEGKLAFYTNHPDTFDLTVTLSRITFCYLLFMALVAHLSGVLNTFKVFGAPAAAPILLNIVFLAGLGIFVSGLNLNLPAHVLSWCVAVAGLLQFLMLYVVCFRKGYHVKLQKPVFDSSIKKLFLLMGPGILAAGIQQVNLLIGGIIASFQQGAISWLYYSDRVYQLPLGMIGIALGVVLLPEVTRLVRKDDIKGASDSMVRGMELGLLITLPAAIAMLVIPIPIISVLFQRGEFTVDDVHQTGMALRGFALGLPGYVLIKVLQPGFFARENTKAPMMMALVTVIVNIVVSLALFAPLGHVGIAIATTVAAWVNVYLLARGLKGFVKVGNEFWRKSMRITLASVMMGGAVWLTHQALGGMFNSAFYLKCIALAILIAVGMGVYGALALVLKVTSVSELKASFKRG